MENAKLFNRSLCKFHLLPDHLLQIKVQSFFLFLLNICNNIQPEMSVGCIKSAPELCSSSVSVKHALVHSKCNSGHQPRWDSDAQHLNSKIQGHWFFKAVVLLFGNTSCWHHGFQADGTGVLFICCHSQKCIDKIFTHAENVKRLKILEK